MPETASFVGFDDILGRVVTGGIDPMTNDVFNTNSSLRENENTDDVPSTIFCDVALFRRYACDNDSTDWIIDSCATNMQKTLWGIGLKEINQRFLRFGIDHLIKVRGTRVVLLLAKVFGGTHPVCLKNTSYLSEIENNLFSVQEIARKWVKIVFDWSKCIQINSNKKVVAVGQLETKFYIISKLCKTIARHYHMRHYHQQMNFAVSGWDK